MVVCCGRRIIYQKLRTKETVSENKRNPIAIKACSEHIDMHVTRKQEEEEEEEEKTNNRKYRNIIITYYLYNINCIETKRQEQRTSKQKMLMIK